MQRVTLISIVFYLKGGMGHVLNYHLAVGAAVQLNGWQHRVATTPDEKLSNLPEGWVSSLNSGVLEFGVKGLIKERKIWALFKSICKLSGSVATALQKELARNDGDIIVFLESFNALQLLSVLQAMLFVKKDRLHFWLLYRHEPRHFGMGKYVYKLLTACLKRLFSKDHFRILTDSEVLQTSLSAFFKQPVHVLPIPHTQILSSLPIQKNDDEIICWWPGSPRPEKGWDVIRRIAQLDDVKITTAKSVRLIVSEAANIQQKKGKICVDLIKNILSADEYYKWMLTSDLILLPYDSDIYRASTSGIFTETIVAGKIPLVSDNTWMAFELKKYNLIELIVDWNNQDMISKFFEVVQDNSIRLRIEIMQAAYINFHSKQTFANELYKLI